MIEFPQLQITAVGAKLAWAMHSFTVATSMGFSASKIRTERLWLIASLTVLSFIFFSIAILRRHSIWGRVHIVEENQTRNLF